MYLQFCYLINSKTTSELAKWMFENPEIAKDCIQNFFNSYELIEQNLGRSMASELLATLEEASYQLDGYLQDEAVMYQETTGTDTDTIRDYYRGDRVIEVTTYSDRYKQALSLVDFFNFAYSTLS